MAHPLSRGAASANKTFSADKLNIETAVTRLKKLLNHKKKIKIDFKLQKCKK